MPDEITPTLGIQVSNEETPSDASTRLHTLETNKNFEEEVTEVKHLLKSHLSNQIPLMHKMLPLNDNQLKREKSAIGKLNYKHSSNEMEYADMINRDRD